ncbi:glutathione S-transferase family protein [Aestuariispira ectoiniformans]|uniref:glutathione S-transferase family protein n=1 Tax=Aestuariispira ectoiniformans TaxID=2775080 RepID=UPI00223A80E3|nr:glutathione S-transferase [Aestuariispira ectoiniformans]
MKLIGMLDSPYVRRVAISMHLLDLPFEHQALSVFSDFDAFAAINPVVKAPTLVTDGGGVLMDSGLILEHAERLANAGQGLSPADPAGHAAAQRIIGLALAACEKTVQIVYEHHLRPADKRHEPWLERIQGQLTAAYDLLEQEVRHASPWCFGPTPLQADITSAVAFRFTQEMLPEAINGQALPALTRLSDYAESTAAFAAYPFA